MESDSELLGSHVNDYVDGNEKVQLHVTVEGPCPVETAAIGLLKEREYVPHKEKLCPPV